MKFIILTLLFSSIMLSCSEFADDPEQKFPKCVGIEASFNPYNIVNPYSGKIWSEDTIIYTKFIFTDYIDYNYLLSAERSWNMWIKFTNGSTTKYQSCDCYYSYMDKKYYAWTGFDYKGRYSSWDFSFETFTCSKLSGSCEVVITEIPITLYYRFEGTR